MRRLLKPIGAALTLAYFGFILFTFNGRFTQIVIMDPNHIGDLLAGIFGPVAFLWLVLGYLQQGIEIDQNTDALKLQAEQLKISVRAHQEMVDLLREELELNRKGFLHQRLVAGTQGNPQFVLSHIKQRVGFTTSRRNENFSEKLLVIEIKNVGEKADSLKISIDGGGARLESEENISVLQREATCSIRVLLKDDFQSEDDAIRIQCKNHMQEDIICVFGIKKDKKGNFLFSQRA